MKQEALGVFTPFESLEKEEKELVLGTWDVAKHAYVPRSHFPVGAVLLAANEAGDIKTFAGCNVENHFFNPTICAERNAMTSAVAAGYTRLLKIALVIANYQGPGASPCGLCRQVLTEFGCDATVFEVWDKQNNVHKFTVRDLLPAASGTPVPHAQLSAREKRVVKRLKALLPRAYVPYSKAPHAALVVATNAGGAVRHFGGVSDDNASYGGSALAELVALRTARTAGYDRAVTLCVTVDDPTHHNPIEGECLQVLREFGLDAKVLLVGADGTAVRSSVFELLPDSFGPESLA